MSALAKQRARIARVRRVQHLQAVGAAAVAEGRLVQLEGNAARLAAVRATLAQDVGATSGAALGNVGELAVRLDTVRAGLTGAIDSARDVVDLRTAARTASHIKREGAERLQVRAVAEMQALIEQRMTAAFRPRFAKAAHRG